MRCAETLANTLWSRQGRGCRSTTDATVLGRCGGNSEMATSADDRARIFISYRREDSAPHAGRLYDTVSAKFGDDGVFMDVDSISLGLDFAEAIDRAVSSCDVLLAIIGSRWLTATDDSGRRRLDDPNDWVRLEIEAALERNVRVVPVLVEGAALPSVEDVPPSLAALLRRQAFKLTHEQFRMQAEALVSQIEKLYAGTRTSTRSGSETVEEASTALPSGDTVTLPSGKTVTVRIVKSGMFTTVVSVQMRIEHIIRIGTTRSEVDGKKIEPEVHGMRGTYLFEINDAEATHQAALSWHVASVTRSEWELRIDDTSVWVAAFNNRGRLID
jgi:TIR domain